jgi:uncharacterized repeat protein (TIGR03806 family)
MVQPPTRASAAPFNWYKESSITGGVFYNPPKGQFPSEYVGKYFFNDYKAGWIKTLDPDDPKKVAEFATRFGERCVVDLQVAPDGGLYYLSRNAWVKDNDFKPETGSLWRIRYTGAKTPPAIVANPVPQTVLTGQAAYFRVVANGASHKYQWQRDGEDVPGATSPTYLIPAVTRTLDHAQFRCKVTNDHGEAVSKSATLTVDPSDKEVESERFGGFFIRPIPGTYTGPMQVQLSTETSKRTLRFTTDGSDPTAESPAYSEPVPVQRTATIKVQAFKDGTPEGKVIGATFTIKGDAAYGLPFRDEVSTVTMPPLPEMAPALLSQTGVFASLTDLSPNPGIIPYNVNSPLWSDGAGKRRWIALPAGGRIDFKPTGEWAFPAGTVFVKHFELPIDDTAPKATRRLETRLLVVDGTGGGYGVSYRWRPDDKDADLLSECRNETITIKTATGIRSQTWYFPSQEDCLACHTSAARFVLGVNARQLNGDCTYAGSGISDNQLRTWNYLSMFSRPVDEGKIANFSRLVTIDDKRATPEERARSYIDANCAHCHRPGNVLRATFDARYDTPLADQGILNAATVSDGLNLKDPQVVAPGDAKRSMLLHRMKRSDYFRMPHLASNLRDEAALSVLEQWIVDLPAPSNREKKRPRRNRTIE